MRNLFELFADLQAIDFGPRSLVDLREGLARTTINGRAAVISRAFKWATREEKILAIVYHGLLSVSGL